MIIKTFESFNKPLPKKKFPTEKCVHYNTLSELFEKHNLNERSYKGDNNKDFWSSYIHDKLSKNIVFPKKKISDIYPDPRGLVEKASVFLLPEKYDDSKDQEIYDRRKQEFLDNMKNLMGGKYNEKDLLDNVNFGTVGFGWVNDFLSVVYNEFKQYYKDGYLRVWMPADIDDEPWSGYDFPHKYSLHNSVLSTDGIYYLSEVEKYINDRYGISDDKFYDFLIKNQYIEGRYWERTWSLSNEKYDINKKLQRDGGKYGMKATENIEHMLNIIEKDFRQDFVDDDYKPGFPMYVDYFKKVEGEL